MLDIRLLGSPDVTKDGIPLEVDTRKAIAMLAYLAVEHSADRETLAGLFWADASPDRARATLRRTLSSLRSGIGAEAISADRNRVVLRDGFNFDLDEFRRSISETGAHEHDLADVCSLCLAPLGRAARLYRGDFLGAFAVKDSPDFDDWARNVTESLRLEAGAMFARLAMALASSGDYSNAIATASRWIGLDELHEPAHRLLMLLNAWAGDRPGAIQAYRDCVAILDRELGVAPLEETTELFEAILDEDLPPPPGVRKSVKSRRAPRAGTVSHLIGRREEVAAIGEALEGVRSTGRLMLITGDSWMGKTRLLELARKSAQTAGLAVVSGRAQSAESQLPYGVVTQLLDDLAGYTDLEELPDWVLGELTRLDPKLAPGTLATEAGPLGQLRLREAFLALTEHVASMTPLVMTVDDAQWVDDASAGVLAHVHRRSEGRVLVIIAARDEVTLHPSIREITTRSDDLLALGPLTVGDLADTPSDVGEEILAATGGIPLLVMEALDSGRLTPGSSGVLDYMESRQRLLSDLARQVMTAAAVLDGLCDGTLLRDTSGRTEDEIVVAVEELVGGGLLREHEDGRLGFTLDILEKVTYESTSLIRRRLLHKRAAEALESRARTQTDARLATATAGHLQRAGGDDAAEWYRLAGQLSRQVHANREAANAFETAIALGHPDVGSIHLALGEIALTGGEYETAGRELQAAASQSSGATLSLVEHRIGAMNRLLGRFDLAEESFTRAEAGHPARSDLYAEWALLRHRLGDDSAVDLADKAVETAASPYQLARALNVLGLVTRDRDLAMAHIDRALGSTQETDPARMAALNNKAHLLSESGDVEGAIELVTQAILIATMSGHRHQRAALLNHLADLNHRVGNRGEAEAALTQAVTIFADIDAGDWRPEVWLLRQW